MPQSGRYRVSTPNPRSFGWAPRAREQTAPIRATHVNQGTSVPRSPRPAPQPEAIREAVPCRRLPRCGGARAGRTRRYSPLPFETGTTSETRGFSGTSTNVNARHLGAPGTPRARPRCAARCRRFRRDCGAGASVRTSPDLHGTPRAASPAPLETLRRVARSPASIPSGRSVLPRITKQRSVDRGRLLLHPARIRHEQPGLRQQVDEVEVLERLDEQDPRSSPRAPAPPARGPPGSDGPGTPPPCPRGARRSGAASACAPP